MEKRNATTEKILQDRFGQDCMIALATVEGTTPSVRGVNAFYDAGSFYILTYALSDKMRQIEKNPQVAISGEWFTAHGLGRSLGWVDSKENQELARKMRTRFSGWMNDGHIDFTDRNIVILQVELSDGILVDGSQRYEIDFRK